jgi:HrpA-like RNA helicase
MWWFGQRAGRAGRTGPGHCYRLYSSAVFERFPQFDEPEVLRMPIGIVTAWICRPSFVLPWNCLGVPLCNADGVVLQLKSMGIGNVMQFPFPTPPPASSMKAAVDALVHLSALSRSVAKTTAVGGWDESSAATATVIETESLTPLGRKLSNLPILPRLGAMLLLAQEYGVNAHVAAVVAAMTVQVNCTLLEIEKLSPHVAVAVCSRHLFALATRPSSLQRRINQLIQQSLRRKAQTVMCQTTQTVLVTMMTMTLPQRKRKTNFERKSLLHELLMQSGPMVVVTP